MICPVCTGWMQLMPGRNGYRNCSCGYTCHEKDPLMKDYKTCNKCGWVHFGVSRWHAENEVSKFNKSFDALTKEHQEEYYGEKNSSIRQYEHCVACDESYTNFRDSKYGDCPDGCTINPIISEDKK